MTDIQPSAVKAVAATHDAAVMMGFQNLAAFEFMQRAARAFAQSTMVPAAYQAVVSKGFGQNQRWEENPAALSNCMVALDLAQRMNASPLQVMQNLHVIEGRPSWASAFIIGLINNSGHYAHGLRYKIEWLDSTEVEYFTYEWRDLPSGKSEKAPVAHKITIRNARCIAWTKDKSGERLESPPVTMEMAVQEGWYTRNGSKWRTMPELMMQYRAAAFFGRMYNPELLMGLPTADELQDIIDVVPQADGSYAVPPAAAPTQAAPEAAAPMPRPPRAKPAPAPADEPAAQAQPEPEPEAQPELQADMPVVDPSTGQVLAEAAADGQQRLDTLFDDAPGDAPAATRQPAPEPAKAKRTPKADPVVEPAAPAPEPATPDAAAPAAKPTAPALPATKLAFVKGRLDQPNGPTSAMFKARFHKTPEQLTVIEFPSVLAWFKTQEAGQ